MIFINMENTILDLDHQIQIATQQLAFEKDNDLKQKLTTKLQKLKLKKEIEEIRKRIDALNTNHS